MIEKQIDLIQKQIDKIQQPNFNLDAWKSSSVLILDRIFGSEFQGIKSIEKIKYSSGGISTANSSNFWSNIESCKAQGKEILETCITELETFGAREKVEMSNSGININLTQNQTVNINFLVSALEDELTVSQMKEVNLIMNSDDNSSLKKTKIIDKLKSFGSDIASNILANILTNPSIWS